MTVSDAQPVCAAATCLSGVLASSGGSPSGAQDERPTHNSYRWTEIYATFGAIVKRAGHFTYSYGRATEPMRLASTSVLSIRRKNYAMETV